MVCAVKPILFIMQYIGAACFYFECRHRDDGVPVQIIRKTLSKSIISVAIIVLLLSSFFKCCHSLYVNPWTDVIITAKYFSIVIVTLCESLNIVSMLLQTDKLIKVLLLWLEITKNTERYSFEDLGGEMYAKMKVLFYVISTYTVLAILLYIPVEVVYVEGIDWPALHHLSLFVSYSCVTCLACFPVLLIVCPSIITKNLCGQLMQFLNEIRETGQTRHNVSEYLIRIMRIFNMLDRCIRATSDFFNPTIFIFAVSSTMLLILHLFMFVVSRDVALKTVSLLFSLEVIVLVMYLYICIEKFEEMVGGKKGNL